MSNNYMHSIYRPSPSSYTMRQIPRPVPKSLNRPMILNRNIDQPPINIKYQTNNKYSSSHHEYENDSQFKCYVSLTTTPARFNSSDIINVLESLFNQSIPATKIFLIVCNSYFRKFAQKESDVITDKRISYILNKFQNIEIIRTKDYGPATKLLGLLEYNQKNKFLSENDQIIIVDDDTIYSNNLIISHMMSHQIYDCDISAVNETSLIKSWSPYQFFVHDEFYNDDYMGFLYGWLSFSILYRSTSKVMDFYTEIKKTFPDIFYHDDLLFTLYMYHMKLYVVENKFITICTNNARTSIDSINPLRDLSINGGSKYDLEKNIYKYYNIDITNDKIFVKKKTHYLIQRKIVKRNFYLVKDLIIGNIHENIHVLFTFLDPHNILMTITIFDRSLLNSDHEIVFTLMGKKYSVLINVKTSTKISHILYLSEIIHPKNHNNPKNYCIVQTFACNILTKNKLYSIMTILNNSPEFSYKFYNDKHLFEFIKNKYSDIVYDCVNNLVPGAYISDIFRYCYLYLYGGIYMDCKKILYIPLSDFIQNVFNTNLLNNSLTGTNHINHDPDPDPNPNPNPNPNPSNSLTVSNSGSHQKNYNDHILTDIYIKDCIDNYAYNAIMICDPSNEVMKKVLTDSIMKIIKNKYDKDPLSLTGPGCLGDAIDSVYKNKYDYKYFNIIPVKNNDWLSYNVDLNNKKVIKNTYFGYYDENNYRNTGHYHRLWHEKKIYKKDISNKYKHIHDITDIKLIK